MIHPAIKYYLRFDPNILDSEFLEKWRKQIADKRKPCWDLKYCPYGALVEEFPLLPVRKRPAISHYEYIKNCLKKGMLGVEPNVKPMNDKMRERFTMEVANFNPDNHPDDIPAEIEQWACLIFGHICPVVYVAELVAEEHNE